MRKRMLLDLFNYLRENPQGNSIDWFKQANETQSLDDKDKRKIRSYFSRWKCEELISFSSKKGVYYNIKFTRKGLESNDIKRFLATESERIEIEFIHTYKITEYINQVEKTRDIINSTSLRDIDRLKAIDLQQKALVQIKGIYAYNCLKNIMED